jgi:dTDP-4-amino-4,6-dideoxygalactose transaminase
MADLAAAGIASRRGVMAIHLEPFYRSLSPGVSLPETERAAGDTVLLPLFAGMTVDEQDQVVEALALSLRSAAATARS